MLTRELTTLSPGARRGYLVASGESLGTDSHQHEVLEDDDVVIDEVAPTAQGWVVRYHTVHIHPG